MFNRKKNTEHSIQYPPMQASVMSHDRGLETYGDVRMVRVVSKDYNLLIMAGFAATLGQVEGVVEVITGEDVFRYEDIHGYFEQKNDKFSMIIGRWRTLEADGSEEL